MNKQRLNEIYAGHHVSGQRYGFIFGGEERAVLIKEWVGTNKRVLDLGCRDGSLTRFYCSENEVVGADIDREALGKCKEQLGIATHWINLLDEFPFQEGEFDVVVAAEIIEHLSFPNHVVRKISQVLRPGGIFLGSVPNSFRLKNRLLFLMGTDFEYDPTHLHHFSPGSLRGMLQESFIDIKIKYCSGRLLMLGPRLFGNCMLWRCRKAAKLPFVDD